MVLTLPNSRLTLSRTSWICSGNSEVPLQENDALEDDPDSIGVDISSDWLEDSFKTISSSIKNPEIVVELFVELFGEFEGTLWLWLGIFWSARKSPFSNR